MLLEWDDDDDDGEEGGGWRGGWGLLCDIVAEMDLSFNRQMSAWVRTPLSANFIWSYMMLYLICSYGIFIFYMRERKREEVSDWISWV